jgi:centromeric protein E
MSINQNLNNNNNNNNSNSNKNIKVCIRMRPLLQHEDMEFWQIDESNNCIYTSNFYSDPSEIINESMALANNKSNTSLMNKDVKRALIDSIYSPQKFSFDKVYSNNSNSQIIYKEMCRDVTKSVINGFNCSIFMYGQTTSGKTFTMLGSPNSPGVLPCALRDVFNYINSPEKKNFIFNVYVSYLEIYNENIHDLLTDSNYLKLVEDSKYGVIVAGAKRVKINNFEDGIGIKDFGEENRKYRETLFNEYSSRSHTIFQIFIESTEIIKSNNENNENDNDNNIKDNDEEIDYNKSRFSCLNLIDLAGSERISEYETKNEGSGETGYINKSLFVLANVINKLAENKKNNHIPYRDSKLTRLLSQALGGNSLTTIICTVSPAAINYYQTLSTLRFAIRAKNVKLKPKENEYSDEKGKIEFYKNEIKKLKNELKKIIIIIALQILKIIIIN